MKKTWFVAIGFFALVIFFPQIGHAERINQFSGVITVNNDATIFVDESIIYDFEGSTRHGIYRDIPLKNSDGSKLDIEVKSVIRDGKLYPFTTEIKDSILRIKIGDPNEFVTGIQGYYIGYTVKNALVSFTDYDELYWNVTGNDWVIPMDLVTSGFEIDSLQPSHWFCYRGEYGSTQACPGVNTGNTTAYEKDLSPGEGVTVAAAFEKGVIAGVTRIGGQMNNEVPKNQGLYQVLVLLLAGVSLVGTFAYWWRNRDPKSQMPVVAWYESPNNLEPLVIGTLIDKTTDFRDITAQILSLASRGYLALTRTEKKNMVVFTDVDYLFVVNKNTDDLVFDGDKKVLELLFGNTNPSVGSAMLMSELETSSRARIQLVLAEIKQVAHNFLTNEGYLEKHAKAWWTYLVGVLFVGLAYVGFTLSGATGGLSFIVIPIAIICAFIWFSTKSKYTQRGVDVRQEVLGFKEFLSVTDKERFNFHNAPEKKPTQFIEFLPYAIAFGVEKKWAEQFKDMMIPNPSWYHSNVSVFIAADFASSMRGLSSSFVSASAPASSGSGGGGFSGGGSGGGGGGSW